MTDKIIYFYEDERRCCEGEKYHALLDYAFSKTDYFMLVYVNYFGNGYKAKQKYFKNALKKFQIKTRSNPSWPGTLHTYTLDPVRKTTYKVIFYRNTEEAKEILKEASSLDTWSCPEHPEDLAFFRGNQCWFYSVGHEGIAAIIHADEEDLAFLEKIGVASREEAYDHTNDYFEQYNEQIEK